MKRALILAVTAFLATTACGGGTKVGTAFKNFQGQQGGQRIGAVSTTPTPKPAAGKPTPHSAVAAPSQPKPTKAPAQQASLAVKITSTGFDPTAARVFQGSLITVTNTDSSAHSYTSSDATYDTGSLAPGQSRSFQAASAGKFQMTDRSRNWIIGSLEVVRR